MNTTPSANFAYLAHHDARLVALATQAEEVFASDPPTSIAKLRLFAEVLAKRAAAKVGLLPLPNETQQTLVDRLFDKSVIGATQRTIFHDLRRAGNAAVHENRGDANEALHQLRMARELAVWFQRSFGNNRKFDPGPFIPPSAPKKVETAAPALHDELTRLRAQLDARAKEAAAAQAQIEAIRLDAEKEAKQRLSAEERATKAREDAAIWQALADEQVRASNEAASTRTKELEEQNKKLLQELAALQAAAEKAAAPTVLETIKRAGEASEAIELDEAATRRIIDRQLRDAGWEVDSENLTFERGARPAKGKNFAIAEWPTLTDGKEGWADYVLFAGLQVVGVVEAKRKHKDVLGVIPQAKRYSAGYVIKADEALVDGAPWGVHKVPFLFATNGRPFLRQLKTKSGIWFLDARRAQNHPVALEGWYTPEGLLDLLKQNVDDAHAKLKVEPMPYIDRDYQRRAILAVEGGLEEGKRELLVAMATGTGKTRTCIGLCYRLLKSKRFRRILFLVDRSALGEQTANALKDLRLENLQTFTDIFEVKELADLKPNRETKLQIATIQAMTKRVLGPFEGDAEERIPPVDQYDCIVVDECHRGYLLDREMSDREMLFRDEDDYISKYRRVLDHFDAVKVGLTATPALHTKEIFGAPVFSYSYREAVVDGFLVDHEPPIRIVTKLAQDGIRYDARDEVLVLDRNSQTLKKEELPDEVKFDVEAFNRRVITEGFNRAVIGELVNHIDPEQDEKTLVFCATDEHADMVILLLKEALAAKYGSVDDDAVAKITGATDRYLEVIRRYRNERHPNIAVTVDLLTTGVDIPKIANLVFLRRVRSRILYEQMLGRATRLCPEIGKERFRIFDAVDLYSKLQDVTDMKPVVVNPLVTFEQLVKEVLESKEEEMRLAALEELLAKLQRKKRALKGENEDRLQTAAGMSLGELASFLKTNRVGDVANYLREHPALAPFLDRTTGAGGYKTIVSEHVDEVREVTRGYGRHGSKPPADYLDAFRTFLASNMNRLPALLVVTQRPRELTREDLRQLKLALDEEGFNEASVQTAWRDQKSEDIAATIVGYIRQLALGSPLVPYAERVDRAVARLRKARAFTDPQVKWLERIAKQMKHETVVDKAALDAGQFKSDGGFTRLNKVFDGSLETLLGDLADEVWKDAG
ncbi:Type I restriction-modification system, restriction subunit R [Labilithrix luteola]|uniref:Type I restriction-modification system, restriction subunit R n=1 Tax=Labilithrix luteola TaxID=1391654 RepID=A0A0K1QEZ6_9BACT|nr:type I restriction-modification system endonuclease [Labilithrix luteola]AKV04339.1 Type I restriction-modification system, restriction subunit R [Labilithrix luteola]